MCKRIDSNQCFQTLYTYRLHAYRLGAIYKRVCYTYEEKVNGLELCHVKSR